MSAREKDWSRWLTLKVRTNPLDPVVLGKPLIVWQCLPSYVCGYELPWRARASSVPMSIGTRYSAGPISHTQAPGPGFGQGKMEERSTSLQGTEKDCRILLWGL